MAYNTIEYNSIKCNTLQYKKQPNLVTWETSDAPKRGILGQNRPDTRPNCVVIMSLTKRWQLGPNLAPRGPPRTTGFLRPKQALFPVFDRFIEVSGSIWALTVLDEQGVPLRCSGPGHIYIQPKFYEDIQLDNESSKPIQQRLEFTRIYVFCRENISVANYAFLG